MAGSEHRSDTTLDLHPQFSKIWFCHFSWLRARCKIHRCLVARAALTTGAWEVLQGACLRKNPRAAASEVQLDSRSQRWRQRESTGPKQPDVRSTPAQWR